MIHANLEKAIVIRMLRDPSFKQKLLNNPKETVKEFCKDYPEMKDIDLNQVQIRVEQEKKNEWVLVIPYLEENSTLSDRDLERLAAGGTSVVVQKSVLAYCDGGGIKFPW